MISRIAFVLLCGAGCGKVALAPDAAVDAGLPDAVSCTGSQMACGTSCTDLMTAVDHCGSCDLSCDSMAEDCIAGHCVDYRATCATIHAHDAANGDGLYTFLDGVTGWCDMAANVRYDALGFGQYNVAYTGWTPVTLADLQSPGPAAAFIGLYNHQTGATLISSFTSSNCCIKAAGTTEFEFGADYLIPYTLAGTSFCGATAYTDPFWRFGSQTTAMAAPFPLPDDFFTTRPPTAIDACTDNNNPAFFWKKHP